MDGDEEDAMLEAIQGLALDHAPTRFLNGGPDFDFSAVQQLSEADKKVEPRAKQVPVPPTDRRLRDEPGAGLSRVTKSSRNQLPHSTLMLFSCLIRLSVKSNSDMMSA